MMYLEEIERFKQKLRYPCIKLPVLLVLMEDGAVGHPGHLAVEIVALKQEEESATNHGPLMEGHFVEDLLMKKQDVICISVQLMEDGTVGHHGLLAV